jgi:hypothetical protein
MEVTLCIQKNHTKMRLFFIALLIPVAGIYAQKIEEKKIKTHVTVLAADDMEGRFSGSEGERKAIAYIEKEFKALKLTPKGEQNFQQAFPFQG